MTKQWAFYFEQNYCSGCCTCQIACKDKNDLKTGQQFRKVTEYAGGGYDKKGQAIVAKVYAFWLSISCNHCQKPVCVKKCPVGALVKNQQNGIVRLDSKKCIGCGQCLKVCPYDALVYDQANRKMRKCDFCEDLLAKGEPPACVAACPMRALDYGELSELQENKGAVRETYGLPAGEVTQPALCIVPHRDVLLAQKETNQAMVGKGDV